MYLNSLKKQFVDYVFKYLVDNEVISSIGKGLCVLIGISKNDSKKDMDYM